MLRKQTLLKAFVVVAIAAFVTVAARADGMDTFNLTGNGLDVIFTLPSSPTPDFADPNFFEIDDVSLNANGVNETADLLFFSDAYEIGFGQQTGGFGIYNGSNPELNGIFPGDGELLYTGTVILPDFSMSDVTFVYGNYVLTSGDKTYDLDITPEPSSLLLLATGVLGLLGAGTMKRCARGGRCLV